MSSCTKKFGKSGGRSLWLHIHSHVPTTASCKATLALVQHLVLVPVLALVLVAAREPAAVMRV